MVAALLVRGFERGVDDWIGIALWAVGTSYASVLVVAMRVLALPRFRKHFRWALVLPWLLFYTPALALAFFGSPHTHVAEFWQALWVFPGFAGYVAAPLLVALFAEVVVRRLRAARPPPPPPELPIARVRSMGD